MYLKAMLSQWIYLFFKVKAIYVECIFEIYLIVIINVKLKFLKYRV